MQLCSDVCKPITTHYTGKREFQRDHIVFNDPCFQLSLDIGISFSINQVSNWLTLSRVGLFSGG